MNNVQLKEIPLFIKNPFDYSKYFTKESCNVSVLWCVYDKRKNNNCERFIMTLWI